MKLIRTIVALAVGFVSGYMAHSMGVELPEGLSDKVEYYTQQLERAQAEKDKLQAEVERLRSLVEQIE